MLQEGILLRSAKWFRLVPSEIDKMSMNNKNCMMGDCHVRYCERLAMQNVGLLN